MKSSALLAAALISFALVTSAYADALVVSPDETIAKVVAAQSGKVVTLKIGSSEELTGKVKMASAEVVHLTELSGKEYFDAAVSTRSITAVLVRTR